MSYIDGFVIAVPTANKQKFEEHAKIGGGVSTVRQYLQAGLVDEVHFAISPVVLGQGEAMFVGIDLPGLGFSVTERASTEAATHIVLAR